MYPGKLGKIIVTFVILGLLSSCATTVPTATATTTPTSVPATPTEAAGLANPASLFCEAQGGRVDIRTESGGEVGYCAFPTGAECEEWAFFRGECAVNVSVCNELKGNLEQRLGVVMQVTEPATFEDPISGQQVTGCQVTASGTGTDFESVGAAVATISETFQGRGWEVDNRYAASGPNGEFGCYRQAEAMCLWVVKWEPAAEAACPADQPISACEIAPEHQLYTLAVNCTAQ